MKSKEDIAKGPKKNWNTRYSNHEKQMDEMRANKDDIQDS